MHRGWGGRTTHEAGPRHKPALVIARRPVTIHPAARGIGTPPIEITPLEPDPAHTGEGSAARRFPASGLLPRAREGVPDDRHRPFSPPAHSRIQLRRGLPAFAEG